MRKISFLLAVILISSTASFAQLEKNQFYTGFSLTRGFGEGSTLYELRPSASIALGKHSLLSLYGRYQRGREFINPYFTDRTGRVSEYGIGASYTYYRNFKKNGKWGWFIDASASMNWINNYDKSPGTVATYRQREKQLLITPGIFFKASPRVMFFADFGSIRAVGDQPTNNFGNVINIGVKITLGKIGKKNKR